VYPTVRFALALTLILVGAVVGYRLRGDSVNESQIAQIRDEVRTVNRLLTVSLLRQQSASERLQGVNRSYKLDDVDTEITNALLLAFKHDPNVNVRLAALDALSRNISQQDVRHELITAIQTQSSPMVQIAIVDLMVQIREKQSTDVLKQMLQKSDVNDAVKKRIEQGIQQLNS
jgi:HEAT repeat protein